VVEEGINHMWTLSAMQNHANGIIVCDEEATMELKVGTVKYFRDTL
jgi:glucosamine-6-phosphate deaminase